MFWGELLRGYFSWGLKKSGSDREFGSRGKHPNEKKVWETLENVRRTTGKNRVSAARVDGLFRGMLSDKVSGRGFASGIGCSNPVPGVFFWGFSKKEGRHGVSREYLIPFWRRSW